MGVLNVEPIRALTGVGRGRDSGGLVLRLGRVAVVTAVAWIAALVGAGIAAAQLPPGTRRPARHQQPAGGGLQPQRGLVATADKETGTVSVFLVGVGGHLREAFRSPFHSGAIDPMSLAFSPDGRLLAVANRGGDPAVVGGQPVRAGVSMFSVSASGALTPVAGSPFHTDSRRTSVAWSSTGRLAVADELSNTVSLFSVSAGGDLHRVAREPLGQIPCGGENQPLCARPVAVRFSPDGGLLATANSGNDTVSVFSVGPGGALNEVGGSPYPLERVPAGGGFAPAFPGAVSLTDGGLIAVVSANQSRVYMFSVGAQGLTLEQVHDLPPSHPDALSFSPSGELLAIASYHDRSVRTFSVGPNGELTQVATAATGPEPGSVAFSSTGLLATANYYPDGSLSVFSVEAGGGLQEVADSPFVLRVPVEQAIWERVPGTPVDVSPGVPAAPAFNLNGDLLAVPVYGGGAGNGRVFVVSVSPHGGFENVQDSPYHTGSAEPFAAAFSPDGRLLATANDDAHSISVFTVGAGGVLSDRKMLDIGPTNCGPAECWRPFSVAFHPDGHYLAVASIVPTNPSLGTRDVIVQMLPVKDGQISDKPVEEQKVECLSPNGLYNNVAFNSTGTLLAASCSELHENGHGGVFVFKVQSDGSLTLTDKRETGPYSTTVAFGGPDGNLLALPSHTDSSVWLMPVDNDGLLGAPSVEPTGEGPYGAAFGPAEGPLGALFATADYYSATVSLFLGRGWAAGDGRGRGRRLRPAAAARTSGTPR